MSMVISVQEEGEKGGRRKQPGKMKVQPGIVVSSYKIANTEAEQAVSRYVSLDLSGGQWAMGN